jgi:DNA-binding beta-propeller fold protein YncE
MTEGPPPQLSFSLDNPGAPHTIYISATPTDNKLVLQVSCSIDATATNATLVEQSQAGAATGSLFYLDLSPLKIDATLFATFELVAEGWQSQAYGDTGQIAFTPTTSVDLKANQPIQFTVDKFALPNPPGVTSASLKLSSYHVPGLATGPLPRVSSSQTAFLPPPSGKLDLHQAMTAALQPGAVAISESGYPQVSNALTLTLSQVAGQPAVTAGPNTVFTLSVAYAEDKDGFGALMNAAEGKSISIPNPALSGWKAANVDGLQGRSWTLTPTNKQQLPAAGGSPVSFDIEPIVTTFQAGPTVVLLSYSKVPGYADGAFAMTLIKEPHARIDTLTATPALSTLTAGKAEVDIAWTTAHAGTLILDPLHKDVSGLTHCPATIGETTVFTLTAYGSGSGDVDNIAIKNVTATVIPVLDSFTAQPQAISVDDFGRGGVPVTLTWAVNAPRTSVLTLTSSATGPFSSQFQTVGSTIPSVAEPQMFTLGVQGDTRPQDAWRLYVPAFTLQPLATGGAPGGAPGGAYAVAAPGASYIAVSQGSSNQLAILSSSTYSQIATVGTGANPQGIAFAADGSALYVANQGDGTISSIAVAVAVQTPPWSFTAGTPYNVGGHPAKVALGPNLYLFASVANGTQPGSLAMVTLSDGTINQVPVGVDPYGLAVIPSGAQVFVANRGDGTVSQVGISPDGTPQLIRTLAALPGAAGLVITPDGNTMLVACSDGTVRILDATAPDTSPQASVQVGGRPMDIALDPSGAYAFVTDNSGGRVSLINIAKQAVVGTPVSVGGAPLGISVSPDGMLVAVGFASSLTMLTLAIYTLRSSPPNCGGYVTDVRVSGDGNSAFVWADATYRFKQHQPAKGVHVYDVPSETLRPTLATTPVIDIVAPPAAGTSAFLTQKGQSAVYPFDTHSLALGTAIAIPSKGSSSNRQPLQLAASDDGTTVFVLVSDGSLQYSIVVLTGSAGASYTIAADVTVYTAMAPPLGTRLAAAPDGSAAYTYDGTNSQLWRIRSGTGTWAVDTPLALGIVTTAGLLMSPDGDSLYVAGQAQLTTTFYLVDTAAWSATAYPLSDPVTSLSIRAMTLSPDGSRILVSDPTNGTIRLIDSRSLRFVQTLADPGTFTGPTGVAMTPDQSRLFVGDLSGLLATAIQVRPSAATQEGDEQ